MARETLYRALSTEGNPEFATILKGIHALGLNLHGAATEGPATVDRYGPILTIQPFCQT